MQYTEKELAKLIEDVETEFTAQLAKAEEEYKTSALVKSETTAVATESATTTTTEQKVEAKVEKTEAASTETQPLVKAEEHEDEEHCDYDDEDHKEMHKMYKSMKKGEAKAHYSALHEVMQEWQKGNGGQMEKEQPGKLPGAVAEASKECSKELYKTEEISVKPAEVKSQPNPEMELLKSEIEAQKAKNEDLKKNLDAVSEFLTKLVKKAVPQSKAITEIGVIAKSEGSDERKDLTKGEVTAILSKKASDPTLSKSDRDAINEFYLNGASLNSVSHLLK